MKCSICGNERYTVDILICNICRLRTALVERRERRKMKCSNCNDNEVVHTCRYCKEQVCSYCYLLHRHAWDKEEQENDIVH